jgi:cytochrome c-type biogenesis protein CcmH/NrfF
METLILWLWGPTVALIVILFALFITRRQKMHPGE